MYVSDVGLRKHYIPNPLLHLYSLFKTTGDADESHGLEGFKRPVVPSRFMPPPSGAALPCGPYLSNLPERSLDLVLVYRKCSR
jgi:hypothetical protein